MIREVSVVAAVVLLFASHTGADDSPKLTHIAAKKAVAKYEAKIRDLDAILEKETRRLHALRDREAQKAKEIYLAELKSALSSALAAENLEQANIINGMVKKLGAAPAVQATAKLVVRDEARDLHPAMPRGAVEFGDSYYFVYAAVPMNHRQAAEFCRAIGGHLAYIESAEENAFIANLCEHRANATVLIGGSGQKDPKTWRFGDGSPMTYFNFRPRAKLNFPLNYSRMIPSKRDGEFGMWIPDNGSSIRPFVCEWDK